MSDAGFSFQSFSSPARPPEGESGPAYWFLYKGASLLVAREGDAVRLPFTRDLQSLGLIAGHRTSSDWRTATPVLPRS